MVELGIIDRHLLESFQKLVPVYSSLSERTRNTNFKKASTSVSWKVFDMGFRQTLFDLGLPVGKKSKLIGLPKAPFIKRDFFRGLIDGDGSVGITSQGLPFVSHGGSSPEIAQALIGFVRDVTGAEKTCSPNKRDGAYNVSAYKELAQVLAAELYYPGCLALERKRQSSLLVQEWKRPEGMVRKWWPVRSWGPAEDDIVLTHSISEAMEILGRSKSSVGVVNSTP